MEADVTWASRNHAFLGIKPKKTMLPGNKNFISTVFVETTIIGLIQMPE
jgi:hypothetical protein